MAPICQLKYGVQAEALCLPLLSYLQIGMIICYKNSIFSKAVIKKLVEEKSLLLFETEIKGLIDSTAESNSLSTNNELLASSIKFFFDASKPCLLLLFTTIPCHI